MQDITAVLNRYRECVRHLWNTQFWLDAESRSDWDLAEEFEEIAARLFDVLVLWKCGVQGFRSKPVNVGPSEPIPFLRIEVTTEAPIMINRGDKTPYWDDPVKRAEPDDFDLRLVNLFQWGSLDFREYSLYRVRVVASSRYPAVVGRDALVGVGTNVKVFFCESDVPAR